MNIPAVHQSILEAIKQYQVFLEPLSEEEFQLTPPGEGWSYSEVYSHILYTNMAGLAAIESCIRGNKNPPGSINLIGRLMLFFGTFSPIKLKAPAAVAAKTRKISLEEARNELIAFVQKLNEVFPKCVKTGTINKVKHPRLGMLNARQWFRFIEIHSFHHIKQLRRIKKILVQGD